MTHAGAGGGPPEAAQLLPAVESCGSLASLADTTRADVPPTRPVCVVKFDSSMAELGELRAECVARGQSRAFLRDTFEVRCRKLFPRDLIVAKVPTRKGGLRTVGALRRSLRWCKEEGRCIVFVDFVFVLRGHRGQGIGRRLLESAMLHGKKPKPVGLVVAGSEANVSAVALYESLGFRWTDGSRAEMLATEEAVRRLAAARASPADVVAAGTAEVGARLAALGIEPDEPTAGRAC